MAQEKRVISAVLHEAAPGIKALRIPIAFLSMITSLAGHLAAQGKLTTLSLQVSLSVGLVTLGALILNNIQDRDIDSVMTRTIFRTAAMKKIKLTEALLMAISLIISGSLALMLTSGSLKPVLLCLTAVIFYNFLYTRLKRKTLIAIIPGIMSGAMPVYIGWISAGGPLISEKIILLTGMLAVWQLPHLWIINIIYYNDYKTACLPNMADRLSIRTIGKLIFLWSYLFSVITLCVAVSGIIISPVSQWLFIINGVLIIAVFIYQIFIKKFQGDFRFLFNYLNFSITLLFIIIITDFSILQ